MSVGVAVTVEGFSVAGLFEKIRQARATVLHVGIDNPMYHDEGHRYGYGAFVDAGTGIYGSRRKLFGAKAVRAKVMAFKWRGRSYFVKAVGTARHGGAQNTIKGQPPHNLFTSTQVGPIAATSKVVAVYLQRSFLAPGVITSSASKKMSWAQYKAWNTRAGKDVGGWFALDKKNVVSRLKLLGQFAKTMLEAATPVNDSSNRSYIGHGMDQRKHAPGKLRKSYKIVQIGVYTA